MEVKELRIGNKILVRGEIDTVSEVSYMSVFFVKTQAIAILMKAILNRFNYLHQLQNLYFALTGIELKINI